MTDFHCPSCGLVLYERAANVTPVHCPRCNRRRRQGRPGRPAQAAHVARKSHTTLRSPRREHDTDGGVDSAIAVTAQANMRRSPLDEMGSAGPRTIHPAVAA